MTNEKNRALMSSMLSGTVEPIRKSMINTHSYAPGPPCACPWTCRASETRDTTASIGIRAIGRSTALTPRRFSILVSSTIASMSLSERIFRKSTARARYDCHCQHTTTSHLLNVVTHCMRDRKRLDAGFESSDVLRQIVRIATGLLI